MTTISNQSACTVSLKKEAGLHKTERCFSRGSFGTKSEIRSSRSTSRVYTFANSHPLLTKRDLCELLMRRGTSLSSEGKEGNVIGPGGRTEKLLSLEKRGGNIIYGWKILRWGFFSLRSEYQIKVASKREKLSTVEIDKTDPRFQANISQCNSTRTQKKFGKERWYKFEKWKASFPRARKPEKKQTHFEAITRTSSSKKFQGSILLNVCSLGSGSARDGGSFSFGLLCHLSIQPINSFNTPMTLSYGHLFHTIILYFSLEQDIWTERSRETSLKRFHETRIHERNRERIQSENI